MLAASNPFKGAEDTGRMPGTVVGKQVTLRIANQTVAFCAGDANVELFLHDSHAPFRVSDSAPADCQVRWTIRPVEVSRTAVLRSYQDRWELRQIDANTEEITFYNQADDSRTTQPTLQMVSDVAFTTIEIRQAPRAVLPRLAYVSEYPWAEYILQRRFGIYGGIILHASTAIKDGLAHVFMGHSGAGKSTIAELAERVGATIPTDDRTILTFSEDGVEAWGTPWHGSFRRSSPGSAPVGSISLLVHDSSDRLTPIDPSRALKEMFVRTVQARITEREVQTTLETLEGIVAAVPCYELRFMPTTAAPDLVFRTASGSGVTGNTDRPSAHRDK